MPAKTRKTGTSRKPASQNGVERMAAFGEGRRRTIIEKVLPAIDAGRYPIKRTVGDSVSVTCDIYADGHEVLGAALRYRHASEAEWRETPLNLVVNDVWSGEFTVEQLGYYHYTVVAWVDRFLTWEHQLERRVAAAQDVRIDLLIGAALVDEAAAAAPAEAARRLEGFSAALKDNRHEPAFDKELAALMAQYLPRRYASDYGRELSVFVDRERARFSSWYELFPRSTSPEPGRHGTFRDVIDRLPYVAGMGFNVLYFPPIHPIGRTFRKGKNNSVTAEPGEPGSPWAIGAAEGGHKSILPELGTLEDFKALIQAAHSYGLEIAMDIAFQCAPDHPYVSEHPEWFRARPDGTIQYAENPPKKYQDIYPFDFETSDWQGLWAELKSVFDFWIEQGIRIFRVDNPHTKSLRFWEWCIAEITAVHPDVLFLAEAFTKPKLMYGLAKMGFSQSYTYFTWRTGKAELIEYMTELTRTEVHDFYRPNFWPNTPDILTPQFYSGKRATFLARAALAATLTANWGMYGPAYELMEYVPVKGREEYIDNEKYEIRDWDLERPDSLAPFIARLNQARNDHVALQHNQSLQFLSIENDFHENEQLIAYVKSSPDLADIIIVVVNLDPDNTQAGWLQVPLADLELDAALPVARLDRRLRATSGAASGATSS
jgi:starch synthase (maltosyl-transferring)